MSQARKLSQFVGRLVETYTNIHLRFNTSKSLWIKLLLIVSWPLRIIFNLPGQLSIVINYFLGFYIFKVRNNLEIFGRENLPAGANILYLANHQAWFDPWGIGISLSSFLKIIFSPSQVPWTVADEKNYANQWFGSILWLSKMTSVKRGTRRAGLETEEVLEKWKKFLSIGNLVLYFEGTRSRNKEIQPCVKNVARLIFQNFKDNREGKYFKQIIPVRIVGFDDIQPAEVDKDNIKRAHLNPFSVGRQKKCQIIIGKPIKFPSEIFSQDFNSVQEFIRERVRDSVAALRAEQLKKEKLLIL